MLPINIFLLFNVQGFFKKTYLCSNQTLPINLYIDSVECLNKQVESFLFDKESCTQTSICFNFCCIVLYDNLFLPLVMRLLPHIGFEGCWMTLQAHGVCQLCLSVTRAVATSALVMRRRDRREERQNKLCSKISLPSTSMVLDNHAQHRNVSLYIVSRLWRIVVVRTIVRS